MHALCLYPPRGSMTPEELNRTIEFILQSQARLAAAQEQDRQDRIRFEEWSKELFAQIEWREERLSRLFEQQTQLLEHQSQRMDRLDKFYEDSLRQSGNFQ